jgi:hypothetical protein
MRLNHRVRRARLYLLVTSYGAPGKVGSVMRFHAYKCTRPYTCLSDVAGYLGICEGQLEVFRGGFHVMGQRNDARCERNA